MNESTFAVGRVTLNTLLLDIEEGKTQPVPVPVFRRLEHILHLLNQADLCECPKFCPVHSARLEAGK